MAKCVFSEAEVECKFGCGCFCIHGETEEDFECITMCYKCPEPKTGAAGLRGTVLGFDAWIDRRARRRRLGGQTKLAVPTSRLASKRTVNLTGRVDDIVKRLGIIRLDERRRTSR